jgi:hypothetical protein
MRATAVINNQFQYTELFLPSLFLFEDCDVLAIKNYFITSLNKISLPQIRIVNDGDIFLIRTSHCKILNSSLLNKYNLALGQLVTIPEKQSCNNFNRHLIHFKNTLIDLKFSRAKHFLEQLMLLWQKRQATAFQQVLLNDVKARMQSLLELKKVAELDANNIIVIQEMLIKNLKSIMQVISKLYGSRALLSGGVNETIMVFEYFKDIYF